VRFIADDPYWSEIGESSIELDTNDSATFSGVAVRLRSTGQWDALSAPGTPVETMLRGIGNNLFAGGSFLNFDGIANADYIAEWFFYNSRRWSG
jgi:hypothetical protein